MGVAANSGCASVSVENLSWLAGVLAVLGARRRR